jgi:hypothetical protein
VLRRAGLVTSGRQGAVVSYMLSTTDVADLLAAGRRILTSVLDDRAGLREQLRLEGTAQ